MATWREEVIALSPTAFIRADDASGSSARDEIGGTAGTYSGTFALGEPGLVQETDASVKFASGGRGQIRFANREAFNNGDEFAIGIWARITSLVGELVTLVDQGRENIVCRTNERTTESTLIIRSNEIGTIASSTVRLRAETLYFILIGKRRETSSKIYINAVDRTGTVTNRTLRSNTHEINIGSGENGTNEFLPGWMDEIFFLRSLPTAETVTRLYAAGKKYLASARTAITTTDRAAAVVKRTAAARTAVTTTDRAAAAVRRSAAGRTAITTGARSRPQVLRNAATRDAITTGARAAPAVGRKAAARTAVTLTDSARPAVNRTGRSRTAILTAINDVASVRSSTAASCASHMTFGANARPSRGVAAQARSALALGLKASPTRSVHARSWSAITTAGRAHPTSTRFGSTRAVITFGLSAIPTQDDRPGLITSRASTTTARDLVTCAFASASAATAVMKSEASI